MSSRLLNISLVLNLILFGLVAYRISKSDSAGSAPAPSGAISQTMQAEKPFDLGPTTSALEESPRPLRWSELESQDYRIYVANLRKAGCPVAVLRRIISGELKELYAQKAFALVQEFHRDFWQTAARENIREYFDKQLGQRVKALCDESDAMLKQLVGENSRESSVPPKGSEATKRFMDFLPLGKQEELGQLAERYEVQFQSVRETNLSPEEKEAQLAQLRREMEGEQAGILSPEEWNEYQLRQSSAAKEVQELYGVDFSENELRSMAKAIDDYHRRTDSQAEIDPETLDENLLSVLGPARFADFNRARSASYRELYEAVSELGQPGQSAAEIFELRLQSEKQSEQIRVAKNRSPEEKQALLDDLQEQVERAVLTKFGAGAYQRYKASNGKWINALGRL